MTDAFALDMDLLWRTGQIRTAVEATGQDGDAASVADAARHARTRLEGDDPAGALLDVIAGSWQEADAPEEGPGTPLGQMTLAGVAALEEAFSGADPATTQALLEAALQSFRGAGFDVAPDADGDAPAAPGTRAAAPPLSGDEVNALAALLVQVDEEDRDELAGLVDRFRRGLEPLSDEDRTEVDIALERVDAGLEGVRWSERRRALVREGLALLGGALEGLMLALERHEGLAPEDVSDAAPDLPDPAATVVRTPDDDDGAPTPAEEAGPAAEPDAVVARGAPPAAASDPGSPSANPAPRPIPESADPDLLEDFITEGYDHLDMAESALLELESRPDDDEAVNVVFRAFHTIKGVAGFLELTEVAEFAHHAESVLSRVRDGSLRFSPSVADLTLRSADLLRGLLDGLRGAMTTDSDMAVPVGYAELLEILSDEAHVQRLAEGAALELSAAASAVADAEAGPAAETGGAETDEGEGSVRVRTGRLDRLLDLVGELVVSHSMVAEDPALRGMTELQRKVVRSEKILRELQDLTTGMRMVPMKPAFRKVTRVVRDVSRRSGKSVRLDTSGEDTELDRTMVDVLADPLVHMVRNAVDHGIESPEERRAAGKDPEGVVHLNAYQTGGNVVVEITDDGRGLDREKLLQKAIERGVVDSDRGLSDEDVFKLIFAPGFSTAEEVTDISGRGVGMDVVRKAVESLRGRVEITSTPGQGSRFAIHLPLTLAITDGMLMRVGEERYIIPIVKIQSSLRPTPDDLSTVQGRGELVKLHEELLPVVRLHRLYEVEGAKTDPGEALLVILGEGRRRFALMVDEILGQQQFVVKAMSGQVSHAPGVAGGAILGDGRVGLILDPDELLSLSRRDPSAPPAGVAA